MLQLNKISNIMGKNMNRLKVVLAERRRTNRWLAEQLGKDQATVSNGAPTPVSRVLRHYFKLLKYWA